MPLTDAQRKDNQRKREAGKGLKRHEYVHRPQDKPIFKALEAHSKAGTMPDISELLGEQE